MHQQQATYRPLRSRSRRNQPRRRSWVQMHDRGHCPLVVALVIGAMRIPRTRTVIRGSLPKSWAGLTQRLHSDPLRICCSTPPHRPRRCEGSHRMQKRLNIAATGAAAFVIGGAGVIAAAHTGSGPTPRGPTSDASDFLARPTSQNPATHRTRRRPLLLLLDCQDRSWSARRPPRRRVGRGPVIWSSHW